MAFLVHTHSRPAVDFVGTHPIGKYGKKKNKKNWIRLTSNKLGVPAEQLEVAPHALYEIKDLLIAPRFVENFNTNARYVVVKGPWSRGPINKTFWFFL